MKTQKFDLDLKLKMEEILEAKLEAMEDKMERKLARIEKKIGILHRAPKVVDTF
jgi:hypothetical protein